MVILWSSRSTRKLSSWQPGLSRFSSCWDVWVWTPIGHRSDVDCRFEVCGGPLQDDDRAFLNQRLYWAWKVRGIHASWSLLRVWVKLRPRILAMANVSAECCQHVIVLARRRRDLHDLPYDGKSRGVRCGLTWRAKADVRRVHVAIPDLFWSGADLRSVFTEERVVLRRHGDAVLECPAS